MKPNTLTPFLTIPTATLLEAAQVIRHNHSRTAVVVDDYTTRKVLGVISEGDILEATLRGVDVHTPINEYTNYSFTYLRADDPAAARTHFARRGFGLIPVVDDQMRLQAVHTMLESYRQLAGSQ